MATLPGENEKAYPCKICGRNFVNNSLLKHELICQKMQKKREIFDSGKQRATGSDITVDNVLNARKEREKFGGTFPKPKTSWCEKHQTFVSSVSAPKMPLTKDYIKCEYCGSSFNEIAAQRHIPFCKTQQEKKKPIKMQKIKLRQSDVTVIGSETSDFNRLNNKLLNHNEKIKPSKNNCQPSASIRRLSISSRRTELLQGSNTNNKSENDRRRERSSSRMNVRRNNSATRRSSNKSNPSHK